MSLLICLFSGLLSPVWSASAGCAPFEPRKTVKQSTSFSPRFSQSTTSQTDRGPAQTQDAQTARSLGALDELARLVTENNTLEARELGARQLIQEGTQEAVQRLAVILETSSDLAAKRAICRAILRSDRPLPGLIAALLELLGRHSGELDDAIVASLRRFESPLVIPRFSGIASAPSLKIDKRKAAIAALGNMGDELQAISALIDLLGDADAGIRSAALDALANATGVPHLNPDSALAWWNSHRTMTDVQWLREVNDRRMEEIRRLNGANQRLTRRLVAAHREAYLSTPEPERPKKLLVFLGDEATAVRGLGLDLINALITDRKDIRQDVRTRLVEMISDPDPFVRQDVAVMVGDLRLNAASRRLLGSLPRESNLRARAAQVSALGRLDDPDAIPAVIDRLDDEAPEVVGEAATALGALVRRGHADGRARRAVAVALLRRFEQLAAGAEDLRVRFLDAMGRIHHESFRPLFVREMDPPRSIRVRRTAISAMAAYQDDGAADEVRKHVSASEPEIRLAAAQALGRSGRRQEDLDTLVQHMDSSQESNQAVRDRSWESYRAILERSSPQAHLSAAAVFDRPGNQPAQRRRLDLLRSLKASQARYEALSEQARLELLRAMADVQMILGEFGSAIASLTEAMQVIPNQASPEYADLSVRLIDAFVHAGQDANALAHLRQFAERTAINGDPAKPAPTVDVILNEIRARLATAESAGHFSRLLTLIEMAESVLDELAPAYSSYLSGLRDETLAKREARVARLLDSLRADAGAEQRLVEFGHAAVAPRISARLASLPAASRPADDNEAALVRLLKKLLPDWPGYAPDATADERAAALVELSSLLAVAGSAAASTTNPDSSPH